MILGTDVTVPTASRLHCQVTKIHITALKVRNERATQMKVEVEKQTQEYNTLLIVLRNCLYDVSNTAAFLTAPLSDK